MTTRMGLGSNLVNVLSPMPTLQLPTLERVHPSSVAFETRGSHCQQGLFLRDSRAATKCPRSHHLFNILLIYCPAPDHKNSWSIAMAGYQDIFFATGTEDSTRITCEGVCHLGRDSVTVSLSALPADSPPSIQHIALPDYKYRLSDAMALSQDFRSCSWPS